MKMSYTENGWLSSSLRSNDAFPLACPFPQKRGKLYPNLNGYVFQPAKEEYEDRKMEVLYNCAKNEYYRPVANKFIEGYQSATYAEYNTQYVRDREWNIASVTKNPSSDHAHARIDWRFDFTRVGLQVRSLQVRFPTHSIGDGCVTVLFYGVQGDGETDRVDISETDDFIEVPEAVGWREFVLSAEIATGSGAASYNQAQLFRQSLGISNVNERDQLYPFRMIIDFDDSEDLRL